MDIVKRIIQEIYKAQICSDSGKEQYRVRLNKRLKDFYLVSSYGYQGKDEAIEKAIFLIDHNPYCGITYGFGHDETCDHYWNMRIVYFNICLNGRRHDQVSFHSRAKGGGCGVKTRWNHRDSRDTIARIHRKLFSME